MLEAIPREIRLLLLVLAILYVIILIVLVARKKTIVINFENKKEFLEKLNIFLYKTGYHIETEKENFITYKYFYARVVISFKDNTATIIGNSVFLNKIKKLFNE